MEKLCKTIPVGAITTREELQHLLQSTKPTIYTVITSGHPASEGKDTFGPPALLVARLRKGLTILDERELRRVVFDEWGNAESIDLDRFCIGHPPVGNYIFPNYWHAYAFKVRIEHEYRNQHGQRDD